MSFAGKRSQITVMLILGILILGGVSASIYLYVQARSPLIVESSDDVLSIEGGISSCLEEETVLGSYLVASQGGVFESDSNTLLTPFNDVRLAVRDGVNVSVENSAVELAIEAFLNSTLRDCIDKILIAHGESPRVVVMSVKVSILENFVQSELEFPIIFSQPDGRETVLGKQVVVVPLRLSKILEVYNKVVDFSIAHPENINFDEVSNLGMVLEIIPYADSFIIYTITDEDTDSSLGGLLRWNFAVELENAQIPKINFVPGYTVVIGDTLIHDVDIAEGWSSDLKYSLTTNPNTDAFINERTGVINYTAKQAGSYNFKVCAKTVVGDDCKTFGVKVVAKLS
ncbi:hypothetical protein HY483_00420 [Candidatus Woesearchaeota archaeon]|nr:hypothetical protein [Candidatus Woesearchaeota archaeon]